MLALCVSEGYIFQDIKIIWKFQLATPYKLISLHLLVIFQCFDSSISQMHSVQMHAAAIRTLLYSLCTCKGDNPLTKARRLSSSTEAQSML